MLAGTALSDGGIAMDHGNATLGTASQPTLFQGPVVALDGTNVSANVRDANGNAVLLALRLNVDSNTNAVTGSVTARRGA